MIRPSLFEATHYPITPLRAVLVEQKGRNEGAKVKDYLSLVAGKGVIPYSEKGDIGNKAPEDLSKCKLVKPGDFVVNSMNFAIGSFGVSSLPGVCSPVYVVLRPVLDVVDAGFLKHIFSLSGFQQFVQSFGNGILEHRAAIGWDALKNVGVPLPSIDEQRRIADYLDRELAEIDALIAKQEQLITTLDKRRQAVISKFVSKGLNPDAPMTQDAVNVLGHAPRHWTVKRLKYSIMTSKNGVWGEEPRGDETDVWCVRIADFDRPSRSVKPFPRTVRSVKMPERFGRTLARGDLIIEKSGGGDQAPVGCVVMYDSEEPAVCSNFAARLSIASGNSSKYWTYAHAALYFQGVPWKSIKQTSGIQNLDLSSYLNEVMAFPPLVEQLEIAAHLDEATREIDLLVEKSFATTSVLSERRQALISAAVTGNLEVVV